MMISSPASPWPAIEALPESSGLTLVAFSEVSDPERIREKKPDYVLILPWNLTDEITRQMAYIREWGGKFVVPIPTVSVL